METRKESRFEPNYAVHPGIILRDDLKMAKIRQAKLAKLIGIQKTVINEIINGKRNINAKIAVLLETVLPYESEYWIRLQNLYDEAKARIELGLEKKTNCVNEVASTKLTYKMLKANYNNYQNNTHFELAG